MGLTRTWDNYQWILSQSPAVSEFTQQTDQPRVWYEYRVLLFYLKIARHDMLSE